MDPALIVTKYTVPQAGARLVVREHLTEKMLAGLSRRCTLISAPAGFGKSTAAAELVRRSQRQAAWLGLDRDDDDPARFGAYLVAALRQSGLFLGEELEALLRFSDQPRLQALVAAAINAVAAAGRPFVLVLDDYHLIGAGEIHEAVAELLHHMPRSFHVVIATRVRPALPLPWLRARGELSEITASDLRFSEEEAAGFLHQTMGLDLPDARVADLAARTEGWVTGLKLAALSLRGASDWTAAIQRFNGRHPDILAYLVDEVVQRQPESIRAFLRATAICDRLTGSLCDAVTGTAGGQETLQRLAQANLFLAPLDPGGQWYRYHPLFAEFLRARLRDAAGEARVRQLHRRAAAWYRSNGRLAEAMEHLLAACAHAEAADSLETGLSDWSARVSPKTLGQWVALLPKEVVRQRPRLCTMAAWALINHADGLADDLYAQAVDYLAMAATALKRADASQPAVRESLGVLAAVRTALAPWAPLGQGRLCTMQDVAHAAACAEEARSLLPEDSLFWQAVVSSALGQVYLRAGSVSLAAQAFGAAGRLGSTSGNLTAAITALSRQGKLLTMLGQPLEADRTYHEALRLAARHGAESLPALAPVHLGMGLLRYEWNDLGGAEERLAEARRRFAASGVAAPEVLLALARVHQARGDPAAARLLVDQAGELLAAGRRLRADSAAAWPQGVRVLLAQGALPAARRWVVTGGVTADPEPVLRRIPEYLALARVQVAEGQAEAALPLLRSLQGVAAAGRCRGLQAEIHLVQALARHALDDGQAATDAVRKALAVTLPDQFVRLFADEGRPIMERLREIDGDRDLPDGGCVSRLLARLTSIQDVTGAVPVPPRTAPALVEPLTEREEEIIKLIAIGCSNQDVARELFLGVSTVKWHLLNIYGKLQVGSRTQAVARARRLGLV